MKPLYWIIALILVGGLAYFQGCRAGQSNTAEVWQKVDSLQATAKSERESRLRAERAAEALRVEADSLEAVAANLVRNSRIPARVVVDSSTLAAARGTIRVLVANSDSLRTTIVNLRAAFETQKAASARLRLRGDTLESALLRANTRITTLETTLGAVEDVTRCEILGFITCPSRGASLLVGAVAGVALLTFVR